MTDRYWLDEQPGNAPFPESFAVVDEDAGGVVAYFGLESRAQKYLDFLLADPSKQPAKQPGCVRNWRRSAAFLIYHGYPDSDLLGVRPPDRGELIHVFYRGAAISAGDTLFQFLCGEADDDIDAPGYLVRLDRAIDDIRSVRTAVLGHIHAKPPPGRV